ncbi:hypothetical protein [Sediminibacillus massiliensis]|uniref:hypothetical protein n=1 Tax=Sediminibacillus massiliensis TaxID=1926277 RepID=UPI0015C394B1|nr:hypothetical protein [Sediminibacillus massiliensis]
MALDEPKQDDSLSTINGIKVAIEPVIEPHTQTLTLDVSGDNSGLSLLGDAGNCC